MISTWQQMVTLVEFFYENYKFGYCVFTFAGNVFGKIITKVHGYKYEMPDNYKLVNNINIQDLKKLPKMRVC